MGRRPSVDLKPTPTMERLMRHKTDVPNYLKTDPNKKTEEEMKRSLEKAKRWPKEYESGLAGLDKNPVQGNRKLSQPKLIKDREAEKKKRKKIEAKKRRHWKMVLSFPVAHTPARQKEISDYLGLGPASIGQDLKPYGLSAPRHDVIASKKEAEEEQKRKQKAWKAVLRGPSWDACAKYEQLSRAGARDRSAEREQERVEAELRQE